MEHLFKLWSFLVETLKDQRGFAGSDDDPTSDDDKGEEEEEEQIIVKAEDKSSEDKLDPEKIKELQGKVDGFEKDKKTLEDEINKLKEDKKGLQTALHQARQEKKVTPAKPDAAAQLTESQLKQILEDNPGDTETQFNVLKYLAEQVARGVSSETINTAEVNRKKGSLDKFLEERYPDIKNSDSDIRKEVDEVKSTLGLENHPYGDYFAIASRVLDDLPELLKNAFEEGKSGKFKEDTEEARLKAIKEGKLTSPKKHSDKSDQGLTKEQTETFKQMGLSENQIRISKRLVGKKIRTISVEE